MKKVWFMFAMMVCIFASCSDGGSDNLVEPTPKPEEVKTEITIDSGIVSNGLSFGVEGSEQSISFSVNANWTLSVASTTSGATWCKASATSGSKGTANVKFTVDENTGYDDRSVSVTIKAGSVSKTFTITQKGADALLVTTTKYEVAQEGGQIEIEVKANIDYQMEISEAAKEWISEVESKGRALTTTKHKLDIAMNENAEKREGEITFKSGDKVETVKVYQAGGAILLLSQNEYTVSDAGETISVDIKSNVEYGVQMPDVDWITDEASSRGMSSHTLKYIVSANETYDSRSAEIIFYDKNSDLKDTLKVVQAQKDAIVISQKEYNVKAEGETIEVKLSANVDFEVTMPEVDWIKQVSSRALKEHTLYFEVAENEGEDSRNAEIIYTNKELGIEDKVIVKQEGTKPKADVTITVAEAGTLSEHIAEDRIKTLQSVKIIGDLNGSDFIIIKQMESLVVLDLSDANIISGGVEYPLKNNIYNEVTIPTENDVLKECMIPKSVEYFYAPRNLKGIHGYYDYFNGAWSPFSSMFAPTDKRVQGSYSKLRYVELPENIDSIGAYAFSRTNLDKIIIPNVVSIGDYAFYGTYNLQQLIVSEKLKSIGRSAFENCYSLSEVILKEGLNEIGDHAFAYCDIDELYIPTSLKKLGGGVFYDSKCANINILDLKKWCDIEFTGNPSHLSYDYGSNPIDEDSKLYVNDTLLTSLKTPEGLTKLNDYSFSEYSYLEDVIIGNEVDSIGVSTFSECVNLSSVTIGDNVSIIKKYAFYGCRKLNKLILGYNVKRIEDHAFSGINNSIEVYCYAITPPQINTAANFTNEYSAKLDQNKSKLYVPKGTYSTYYLSDWGSIFTNIIEMD